MPGDDPSNDDLTYELVPTSSPQRQSPRPISHLNQPVELNQDVRCAMCGYNLRGLAHSGHCPECGTPIWRSLLGNMLEFASPGYVASLHRGVMLILVALIARIILIGLILFAVIATGVGTVSTVTFEIAASLLGLGLSVVSLIGWWLFSEPDPAFVGTDRASRSRFVLRIAAAVTLVTEFFSVFHDLAMVGGATAGSLIHFGDVMDLLTLIATVVVFFATLVYLRWLAPRFPDEDLDKRAVMYMWLLPIIFIVGLFACGIGPLISIILYYLLINRVRVNLRYLRERQELNAYGTMAVGQTQ